MDQSGFWDIETRWQKLEQKKSMIRFKDDLQFYCN